MLNSMIKNHPDHIRCYVDYRPDHVQAALGDKIYEQVGKKIGVHMDTFHGILNVLEGYTLEQVIQRNMLKGKLPCLKRPNVRAVLLDSEGKLLYDNNELLIGTNNIYPTEFNGGGMICQRMMLNIGSQIDKTLCAATCGHTGCAEAKVIEEAHNLGMHLNGSKLVLFGHTEGPCLICSEMMIYYGVSSAIIGSPPVSSDHPHYDVQYAANGGYKMISTSRKINNKKRPKKN